MNLSALSPAFLTISPSPSTSQSPSFFISFPFASPKLSPLPPTSDSLAIQHPSARRSAFSCLFCSLDSKPMPNFVEEDREAFASCIGLEDDNEQPEKSTRKRTFLAAKSEQELLYGIKKEVEAGRLPLNVAAGMEELYQNYRNAVLQSGIPNAKDVILSNMATALDCILLDVEEPYVFSPYHRALREPFDYYNFGQNYIRPLVDFRNSYVGNISLFNEVEEKLQQGHNIIFISNHQTEADPAVIALSLENTNPYISENLIYVAGDRVVTDPLCKPFSMGRNLICVYSKKHMDDVPELTEMKKKANIRSLKDMASILREGSHIIWISPSGGRDRPDPLTGEWYPAPFDPSAVDNMRRLAEHSGAPGHFYPLALLCHDIMPPPPQVEKEIGEKRLVAFHGTGVSIAPEINFSEIAVSCESSEKVKMAYSQALYDSVCEQYKVLNSAIHGERGLEASTSSVSLSQPWN